MNTLSKRKIRVLIAVLILALAITLVVTLRDSVSPTAEVDELWPENGPVVAMIDGREYRYDPVYLYRLTGCVFDEDPYAIVYEYGGSHVWSIESPNPLVGFGGNDSSVGYVISWDYFWRNSEFGVENPVRGDIGLTMAENAVRLELIYLEQVGKPIDRIVKPKYIKEGREATMDGAEYYLHQKYPGLSEKEAQEQASKDLGPGDELGYNEANLAYCVMMNKSKFKEGQSVNSYLRQAKPYIKKHAMIASYSFPDHTSDDYGTRPTMDELMEKYNVEMIY